MATFGFDEMVRWQIEQELKRCQREQDKQNYPLFFWKETCKPIPNKITSSDGYFWVNLNSASYQQTIGGYSYWTTI